MNNTAKQMRELAERRHDAIIIFLMNDVYGTILNEAEKGRTRVGITCILQSDAVPGSSDRVFVRHGIPIIPSSGVYTIDDVVASSYYGPIFSDLWENGYSLELSCDQAIVRCSSAEQTLTLF